MKKLSVVIMILFVTGTTGLFSAENIEYEIESGKYVVKRNLTKRSLRTMPVPKTNKDYALLQSIGNECNIVIGNFASDEQRITLLKDKNNDGTVDYVAHWLVDLKQFRVEDKPGEFCSAAKFKQYKRDIFYGKQSDIVPNMEGLSYLAKLVKGSGHVRRWYSGYKVAEFDVDNYNKVRVEYVFSDNRNRGVDIIVQVHYHYQGIVKMVPTIQYGIYCKNSSDAFIREMAKEMITQVSGKKK